MEITMVKIIEKCKRSVLSEGRDNGMAFAFLQKVEDGVFHTVQPASPCKDYLAEVVFTEKYGIPTKGCGLYYKKKLDIFSDVAYMAIKMMPRTYGGYSYSASLENDIKTLKDNYKHAERLINSFEKKIGLKILTTITPANDNYFLLEFSSEWCKSTHAISLYSLLIRVLMVAIDADKDIMSFLKSYSYNYGDVSLLKSAMSKIELILKEKKLPPTTNKYSKASVERFMQSPHNNGILNWNSTFDEIQLGD